MCFDFPFRRQDAGFPAAGRCHILPDKAQEARCRAAVTAFGAPYALQMLEIDPAGLLDGVGRSHGQDLRHDRTRRRGYDHARAPRDHKRGTVTCLSMRAFSMRSQSASRKVEPQNGSTMPDGDCFVFAEEGGLVEPCIGLGGRVARGDVLALIHPAGRTGAKPVPYRAPREGLVMAPPRAGPRQTGELPGGDRGRTLSPPGRIIPPCRKGILADGVLVKVAPDEDDAGSAGGSPAFPSHPGHRRRRIMWIPGRRKRLGSSGEGDNPLAAQDVRPLNLGQLGNPGQEFLRIPPHHRA